MSRFGSRTRLAHDESGAAAVEFALIVGVLVTLVMGTIEIGRLLAARNAVSHAVSQAVREVHLNPNITPAEIRTHLEDLLDDSAALRICVRPVPATSIAEIRVEFPFQLRIPFLPAGPLTLAVETIAPRIKNEVDLTDTC